MAIANIKEFLATRKDTPLVLTEKIKEYEAGTQVTIVNVIAVQGKDMAMVSVPGGRPFAAPPEHLSVAGEAQASESADGGDDDIEGPVLDFFSSHANLDTQLGLNFATNYIATFGTDDVSFISNLVEGMGLPVGQGWTAPQTADLAIQFYDAFGLDVDPEAVKVLEEAKAAEAKAAAAPAAATSAKPATKGKKASTAEVPAATTTASADSKNWDGVHIGALRLMGALAPFFAESPDSFNDELALAVKMLNAANKTK